MKMVVNIPTIGRNRRKRLLNEPLIKFVLKILMFSILVLIPFKLFDIITAKYNILKLSNSVCFNVKIHKVKQLPRKHLDFIAIGSSMSLNNLNSQTFTEQLNDTNFYNFSSWGASEANTLQLTKLLIPIFTPHVVIQVSHLGDFYNSGFKINNILLSYTLQGLPSFIIKPFCINTTDDYKTYINDTLRITNMKFDKYGGVELNVKGKYIEQRRWIQQSNYTFNQNNKNYQALEELSQYLFENNITLIFVQAPSRKNHYGNNTEQINLHIEECKRIISKYRHIYINATDTAKFTDECFADHSHMNKNGAVILTKEITNKIKQEIQF